MGANKMHDRMHIWKAVVKLTSFSACLFVLTNAAAIDGGAIVCRVTYLRRRFLSFSVSES